MISATSAFTSANAVLAKKQVIVIEITGYSRSFVLAPRDGNGTLLWTLTGGQVDWIEAINPQGTTVEDLSGRANLGELTFVIEDRNGAITGDFPTFIFEGKKITLKTGFVGMSLSDFVTLFTGQVDSVSSTNRNASYSFVCVDNKGSLGNVIFTVGDDGAPIDENHPRILSGHPLDILLHILQVELGIPDSDIDFRQIALYKRWVYAGFQFAFTLTSAPSTARDFIEQQIMQPLGCYYRFNNLGQFTLKFFYPDNRIGAYGYGAIGAFVDGGGVVVGSPFPLPLAHSGESFSIVVPAGAVTLQVGASDNLWNDNIGDWVLDVSGTPLNPNGKTRPWNSSSNPDLAYFETSSTSPIGISVTPGATLVITYSGHTVQYGSGGPFLAPIGLIGSNPLGPGIFAYLNVSSLFALNEANLTAIPQAGQSDLINTVIFHFDLNSDGTYLAQPIEEFALGISRYGALAQKTQQIIESDGMRSGLQGYFLAAITSRLIFYRYGLKNLTFVGVTAIWTACILEPGDIVSLTESHVPDREAGTIGISGKLFEVTDREWDFETGVVTLTLIDASYLSRFKQYLIAPNSMADFTAAAAAAAAKYMFFANTSDEYSDATPAHTLA